MVVLFGAPTGSRVEAILEILRSHQGLTPAAVLVEGLLPAADLGDLARDAHVQMLGFGCPCCIGALPLFVALTRLLRQQRPKLVVLAALHGADAAHEALLITKLNQRFSEHLLITRYGAAPHAGA